MDTFLNEDYLGTEDIVAIGNKTDDLDLRILCATVLVLRATGAKCMIMSRQRPLWESHVVWTPWSIVEECSVYDRIKHGLTTKHADWRTEITIYQEASPNVVSINKDKAEEILSSLLDTPPVNPLVVELGDILGPYNLLDGSYSEKKISVGIEGSLYNASAGMMRGADFDDIPTLSVRVIGAGDSKALLNTNKGKYK